MSVRVYIRQGDSTDTADDADITSDAPIFDESTSLLELGGKYSNGEMSSGDLVVMDLTGLTFTSPGTKVLGSGCLVTVTEDAAGCEYWLHRGRKAGHTQGRGKRPNANNSEWQVHSDDGNKELSGQPFTEDWVRPAETDYARLVALQAYTLNGTASTSAHHRETCEVVVLDSHFAKNANTVTMPAKTYPIGTEPREVVEDCATTAGKDYGIVRHHGSGFSSSSTPTIVQETGNAADGSPGSTIAGIVVSSATANRAIIALVASPYSSGAGPSAVTYRPNASGGSGASDQAFTQLGSPINIASTADDDPASKGIQISAWYLLAPATSSGATNASVFATGISGPQAIQVYYLSGAAQSAPGYANGTASGATSISTNITSGPADLVLDAIAYRHLWTSSALATVGSGQTSDAGYGGYESFGIMDTALQASHKTGASAMAWSAIPTTSDSPPHWPFCGTVQKVVAVQGVSDTAGCTHLCLQYIAPADLTTNPSIIKISDDPDDIDPENATAPVFGPIWNQGPATTGDSTDLASAIVLRYGVSTSLAVFTEDTGRTSRNDYWAFPYDDSDSVNATQAGLRASALLSTRTSEKYTHAPTIIMRADQIHLVAEGMTVQLKSAAAVAGSNLGSYVTRRIAEVKYSPLSPEMGILLTGSPALLYRVALSLDRPVLKARVGRGNPQSQATAPHSATELPYTPPVTMPGSPTDTQAALDALQAEIDALPGGATGVGTDVTPPQSTALPPRVKPTGSGVITADPQGRLTVLNDANYKSFPGMCFLEGRLHLVYRVGTAHNSSGGTIAYKTSDDLGRTWAAATTLVTPTAGDDLRDPAIVALSSGRLLVVYDYKTPWNGTSISSRVIYSDNRGNTWSSPYTIPDTFSGNEADVTSQPIELPDGTILVPGYGDNGGNYISVVWKSTDGGLTFPTQITVASSGSRHYQEPQIRLLASGEIVCLMRSDTNVHTWRTVSTDNGATWSAPTDVLTASSRPDFVEFFPGALLFFGRTDNTNFYACWAVSWDKGLTWTALQNLDGATDVLEYAAPVVLAPGYVAVAYSLQNSSSDADLYWRGYYDGYGVDTLGNIIGLTVSPGSSSPLTTKGDLYGYSTVDARLPVGTDGYALLSDSSQTLGLRWGGPALYRELLMQDGVTSPPEPLENEAGDDWLYSDTVSN